MINAISHKWCGYTVKSERHRMGLKNQRSWKRTYWINHQPYGSKPNKCGFEDKNTPILPSYKIAFTNEPEMDLHKYIELLKQIIDRKLLAMIERTFNRTSFWNGKN
jgi:hypothetical protein